jgi:hypothetical protein
VLAHQCRVDAGELERAHAVARRYERLDQADRRGRAHRLRGGEPAPPAGRSPVVPAGRGPGGKLLERRGELAGVARALGVLPGVELRRLIEAEALEKRAAVEPHRALVGALVDGIDELADIAGETLRVELEGGAAEEDVIAAERAADGVQRLIERVPGGLGLAVGPQKC